MILLNVNTTIPNIEWFVRKSETDKGVFKLFVTDLF